MKRTHIKHGSPSSTKKGPGRHHQSGLKKPKKH
jgi:hypothetical protein